jgi:hypothetical protein
VIHLANLVEGKENQILKITFHKLLQCNIDLRQKLCKELQLNRHVSNTTKQALISSSILLEERDIISKVLGNQTEKVAKLQP